MKPFRDWKVVTKIACLCLLVAVPPLLGVSYLSLTKFSEALSHAAEARLENIVLNILDRLSDGTENNLLEQKVKNIRIGEHGYAFIIDEGGNLLIHPDKQGENIFRAKDSAGRFFIQQMLREGRKLSPGKTGTIRYPWKNPERGITHPRWKIVKYCYFKPKGLLVAAGSYEYEVFEKVTEAETILLVGIFICLVLVVVCSVLFSRLLTHPLRQLKEAADTMSRMDEPEPVQTGSKDEIGLLAESFNRMTKRITLHTEDLSSAVKQRTKRLEDSQIKYRRISRLLSSIVESSVDGISTTDSKGMITFANSAMCELTGISHEDLLKKHVSEIYTEGIGKAKEIMKALSESGKLMNFAMEMIGDNGRPVPILLSASLLRDREGTVTGTVGVFKNISGLKTLEEKLKNAQVRLLQAEKMRALGDLLAGVAHEINNPLMASGAVLFTVMEDEDLSEDNRKGMIIIKECNRRIKNIVDHLRKFSRESGTAMDPISISSPVEDALEIAWQQLANRGIEVSKDIARGLPLILGNEGQLEQVFLNFIFNARDAMEKTDRKKHLYVSTGIHRNEGNGDEEVEVLIRDTGKGIEKEHLEKIFEPFFTTKQVGEGTGLGLSICYRIIDDHRGRIEVESEVGKSTRFRIILPVTQESG